MSVHGFFFSFYMGKIRRQYYSALKSLCYYRFFFSEIKHRWIHTAVTGISEQIKTVFKFYWAKDHNIFSFKLPKDLLPSKWKLMPPVQKALTQPNKNRFAAELSWNDNAEIFFVPIYLPYADVAMENFTLNFHWKVPLPSFSRICWDPFPPTQR